MSIMSTNYRFLGAGLLAASALTLGACTPEQPLSGSFVRAERINYEEKLMIRDDAGKTYDLDMTRWDDADPSFDLVYRAIGKYPDETLPRLRVDLQNVKNVRCIGDLCEGSVRTKDIAFSLPEATKN